MRAKLLGVVVVCGLVLLAIGPAPRYIEELAIGGGFGETTDGGAWLEKDGDITTDGTISLNDDKAVTFGGDDDYQLVHDGTDNRLEVRDGANNELLTLHDTGSAADVVASGSVTAGGDVAVNGGDLTSTANTLRLSPVTQVQIDANLSVPTGSTTVGTSDSTQGIFDVFGPGPGSPYGGLIRIYAGADYDTTIDRFYIQAIADDLQIGHLPSGDPLMSFRDSGTVETENDLVVEGGDLDAGSDGGTRGVLTAWDGSGGSAPGCVKLASPNGTVWHLFVEDDGTIKVHNALPTQNSDGTEVGSQS